MLKLFYILVAVVAIQIYTCINTVHQKQVCPLYYKIIYQKVMRKM